MTKNRNRSNRNRNRSVKATPVYPVLSLDEAKELNYTSSFCRTLSRSFERIARKGYADDQRAYDYRSAMNAAFHFRQLAKAL